MEKRGQITVFVILGIVVVALVVLLFAFRKDIIPTSATPENLNSIMNDMNDHIEDCLKSSADGPLKRIALQGGYLSVPSGSYRLWNDYTVSYLCYNLPDTESCSNRMLVSSHMEEEISRAVEEELAKCIDLDAFSGGLFKTYSLTANQQMQVSTSIARDAVLFELEFPITLKSKSTDTVVSRDKFSASVDVPLGELFEVMQDIVDAETSIGRFDTLTYMLSKMSRYTIILNKPYPDKIYQLKLRENDYMFQFAVEGEPS